MTEKEERKSRLTKIWLRAAISFSQPVQTNKFDEICPISPARSRRGAEVGCGFQHHAAVRRGASRLVWQIVCSLTKIGLGSPRFASIKVSRVKWRCQYAIHSLARAHTACERTHNKIHTAPVCERAEKIYLFTRQLGFGVRTLQLLDPLFHERRYYFIYGSGKHVLRVSLF
jgi:hypothetical protein